MSHTHIFIQVFAVMNDVQSRCIYSFRVDLIYSPALRARLRHIPNLGAFLDTDVRYYFPIPSVDLYAERFISWYLLGMSDMEAQCWCGRTLIFLLYSPRFSLMCSGSAFFFK